MALGLKYFAEAADDGDTTDRIELYQEGFLDTAQEIRRGSLSGGADPQWLRESYGQPGADPLQPIADSFHAVSLDPSLESDGEFSASILADLKAIASASPHDYLLVHKRGSAEVWRGWVLPREIQTKAHDGQQFITLYAKPRVKSLSRQEARLNTGRRAARSVIADLLKDTGHSLDIVSEATAKPSAETGRSLDVMIPERAFWRQEEGQERPGAMSRLEKLETLLRAFFLRLVLFSGKWHLSYAGAHHTGSTVVQDTYNQDGVYQSTATVPAVGPDLDTEDWVEGSDLLQGEEPYAESRVTYEVGPFKIGDVFNGGFELGADGQTPLGWTDSAAIGNYKLFGGFGPRGDDAGNRRSRGIVAAVTPLNENPTEAEKKAAATIWHSQTVGQFPSGQTDIRLSWLHMIKATYEYTAPIEEQMFVRFKLDDGATPRYWVRTTGREGGFQVVSGDDAKHPLTELSANFAFREDWIEITDFPVTGTLTIEFGQVVRGDLDFKTGDNTLYGCVDNIRLERGESGTDETGEEAIKYVVLDSAVEEGLVEELTLVVGDGPFASAVGSMRLSDGATLTGSWIRNASAPALPHTQMVATERLISSRDSRRRISLQTTEDIGLSPANAFEYDSARFWPVFLEIERPSGRTRVVGIEILENTGATTTTTGSVGSSGFFGGGSVSVFDVLSPRVVSTLARQAITTLSATLPAGPQSTATINPVATKIFEGGESFTIIDIVTNEVYELVKDGDYAPSSPDLVFTEVTFEHPVKAGSYVFKGSAEALTLIIAIEAGASIVVKARELTTFKQAVTGTKTQLEAADIEPLNYRVLDQVHFKARKKNGSVVEFYANGQQDAATTTLDIEATPGAGDAVDFGTDGVEAGESIQPADDKDLVPTKLNVFHPGIEVDARYYGTSSWFASGGTIDANGNILTSGTEGWMLTGVQGQPGNADITGIFHAGAGAVTLGNFGVEIDMPTIFDEARSLTWHHEGSGAKGNIYAVYSAPLVLMTYHADDHFFKDISGVNRVSISQTSLSVQTTQSMTVGANDLYVDITNSAVGIGTNLPTRKLDVIGNVRIGELANEGRYLEFRERSASQAHPTFGTGFGGFYVKEGVPYFRWQSDAQIDLSDVGSITYPLTPQDSQKIIFGTGSDAELYFNGASMILDVVADTSFRIAHGEETMAFFTADGAATLYHDGAAKLATASGGVSVLGNAEAEKFVLTSDGTAAAPAITRQTDTDTGIYFTGEAVHTATAGSLAWSVTTLTARLAGNRTLYLGDADELRLGHNGAENSVRSDGHDLLFRLDSTEVMRLDQAANSLKFPDARAIVFGTGSDAELYFNGASMILDVVADTSLRIAHGAETMALFTTDGSVTLYHDNAVKLQTASGGVVVTGNVEADKFALDTNGTVSAPAVTWASDTNMGFYRENATTMSASVEGSEALRFRTNGIELRDGNGLTFGSDSDAVIQWDNAAGELQLDINANAFHIIGSLTGEAIASFIANGAVELYHDNTKRFETTSQGAAFAGSLVTLAAGTSEPASNTANFPALWTFAFWVDSGASELKVKVRSGTSTYVTGTVASLA